MKKIIIGILSILLIAAGRDVYAKDTMYSLNKYEEENLEYILKSRPEEDNYVVAGTIKEKEQQEAIVVKYSKQGKVQWTFSYGKRNTDVSGITYIYDESNHVNGYLILVEEGEEPIFLTIDLDGKLLQEKSAQLGNDSDMEKIISLEEEGFLLVGEKNNHAFLKKYDRYLNEIWTREYQEENTKIKDIIYFNNSYYGIIEKEDVYRILKYDINGNEIKEITTNFKNTEEPHLISSDDSYLIYGETQDVKLANNKIGSFYLIKFNKEDIEEWETIGNTPVKKDEKIKVQEEKRENTSSYYVMTTNQEDNSIEVVQIDEDGVIKDKVKKLKNEYFEIEDFYFSKENIYFVGHIDCPEDDSCEYDENSLFLVSTEDKVIEVKDNDSKNILIVTAIIVITTLFAYIIRKKRKLEKKKH